MIKFREFLKVAYFITDPKGIIAIETDEMLELRSNWPRHKLEQRLRWANGSLEYWKSSYPSHFGGWAKAAGPNQPGVFQYYLKNYEFDLSEAFV